MSSLSDFVQWRVADGEPITVGGRTITPQVQYLLIRWRNGAWLWNRPLAVLVEKEGQIERLPIIDITRLAQLGLLGLGISLSLFILGVFKMGKFGPQNDP